MDNQKAILLVVAVLVVGLLLGNTFTGQAVRKKMIVGGDGGGECNDIDNDRYFGQTGCGTLKDCNDNNPRINPGAVEICSNGLDDDCDGISTICKGDLSIRTSKTRYTLGEEVELI